MPEFEVKFPAYRKYKNNKSYFKILSPTLFEELQLIGSKGNLKRTEARLYPEKIFIQDLLYHFEERAIVISEQEYQDALRSSGMLR